MLVDYAAKYAFDAFYCPKLLSIFVGTLFVHLSDEVDIVNRVMPNRTTNHQSASTSTTSTWNFSSTTHDLIGRQLSRYLLNNLLTFLVSFSLPFLLHIIYFLNAQLLLNA
jgi:hypothetical protein